MHHNSGSKRSRPADPTAKFDIQNRTEKSLRISDDHSENWKATGAKKPLRVKISSPLFDAPCCIKTSRSSDKENLLSDTSSKLSLPKAASALAVPQDNEDCAELAFLFYSSVCLNVPTTREPVTLKLDTAFAFEDSSPPSF